VLVRTRDDLQQLLDRRAAGEEVTGALFSVEGLQNLEGDFANFFDNEVAGSMHGVDKGGLTDLGEQVFDEMERRGVVIDIAHASPTARSR
jgi:microsomal dipeptidase-like Zn-dependent dipeptidase